MRAEDPLQRLIRAVRQRTIVQLVLEQGAVAAAAGLAGLLLLLLLGTQVFAWWAPLLLLAVACLIGALRLRNRFPSRYQVAQRLDQRLSLQDSVSTALFFEEGEHPGWRAPEALVQAQREAAGRLASAADVRVAAPLRLPRVAHVCFALLAVSVALVVARYGYRGSLDLRQPMVRIPFEAFLGGGPAVAENRVPVKPKPPGGVQHLSVPAEAAEDPPGDRKKAADALEAQAVAGGEREGEPAPSAKSGATARDETGAPGEGGDKGEGEGGGDQQSQKDGGSQGGGEKNARSPQDGGQKGADANRQNASNSSLMEKMRDAFQNMLSRMKMNPQAGDMGKQNQGSQKGAGQQQASAGQKQGQKGQQAPGKQGESQSRSDEAGEQEGEGASKSENAQGKNADAGGEKQTAQQGKSGAGKQDGDKELKDARQEAAMGKISEILGKRAQNLTGEIMVEVSSGRQQLKTQYEQRNAVHGNAAGDISRDEVPAVYQQFVQQYFDEVRKTPTAQAPKPAAPSAKE